MANTDDLPNFVNVFAIREDNSAVRENDFPPPKKKKNWAQPDNAEPLGFFLYGLQLQHQLSLGNLYPIFSWIRSAGE